MLINKIEYVPDELVKTLNNKASKESSCPACKNKKFSVMGITNSIRRIVKEDEPITPPIPALVTSCKNCGFIMQYRIDVLKEDDKREKETTYRGAPVNYYAGTLGDKVKEDEEKGMSFKEALIQCLQGNAISHGCFEWMVDLKDNRIMTYIFFSDTSQRFNAVSLRGKGDMWEINLEDMRKFAWRGWKIYAENQN